MKIREIRLHRVVSHRDTVFPISQGISIIRGENGAGKSLIPATIPSLIFGHTLTTGKSHHSDGMDQGGVQRVILDIAGKKYRISRRAVKTARIMEIQQRGFQAQTFTPQAGSKVLEDLIPLTPEEYFSFMHLTTYRQSPLLHGNGPARRAFLESVFNLDHFDLVHDEVKARLRTLQRKKIQLEEARASLEILRRTRRPRVSLEDAQERAGALVRVVSELRKAFYQIDTSFLKIVEPPEHDVEDLQREEEALRREQSTIDRRNREISNVRGADEIREECLNALDLYRGSVEIVVPENIERERYEASTQLDALGTFLGCARKFDFAEMREISQHYAVPIHENAVESEIARITQILDLPVQDQFCPVCGSPLHEDTLANYEKRLRDMKKLLPFSRCLAHLDVFDAESRGEILKSSKAAITASHDLEVRVKNMDAKIKRIQDAREQWLDLRNQARDAASDLRELEGTDWSLLQEKPRDPRPIAKRLLDVREKLRAAIIQDRDFAAYKNARSAFNIACNIFERHGLNKVLPDEDPQEVYEDMQALLDKLETELSTAQNELHEVESYDRIIGGMAEDIATMAERVEGLEESVADEAVLESLSGAYGKDGLRMQYTESNAEILGKAMTENASLVFPEPFRFVFNVNTRGRFDIIAERNGRQGEVSSTLSGAEIRFFNLLLALCLIPLLPDEKRPRTVFLDEIENGMTKSNRTRIVREFIPELAKGVDSLVYVTPQDQTYVDIPDGREFIVEKENGVSVLREMGE